MTDFVALLLSGISLGAITALVAVGFLLLYRATGVVNFAHGDLVTCGTYLAYWSITSLRTGILAGYLLAIAGMFVVGVGMERVAHAPLRGRPEIVVGIATLGAGIVLRSLLSLWQGSEPKRLPSLFGNRVVNVGGAFVSWQRFLIIGVVALAIVAVILVLRRTTFGRQVRAMAVDPDTARLYGVRTRRLAMIAFGASSGLACLAGILIAPTLAFDLNYGFSVMLIAFAAAILAGFGSIGGVAVAALGLGIAQQLVGGYLTPNYNTVLPYVLLIVGIAIRPQGLFTRLSGSRL